MDGGQGPTRVAIEEVEVSAYEVPTDAPESDGTLSWDATTMVLVRIRGGGQQGLGYSYSHRAAAVLIRDSLAGVVRGRDAMDIPGCWCAMRDALRNLGRPGISSNAIAAVDTALWDLKARLLGLPLADLLGRVHDSVPVYGSGGFTSYNERRLRDQLGGWAEQGLPAVKMKIGREPARDPERVRWAREAIGGGVGLMVDANGAYSRKQALGMAEQMVRMEVSWFEEPVSSDDLEGLRLLRDRAPGGLEISAGEYGYHLAYFRDMLTVGAVDVLQADATRCSGLTGFLEVGALAKAFQVPLSSHTAPALHLHACCALEPLRHMEWFHDHVRIEQMLFEGAPVPVEGRIAPDLSRPGLGLALREQDAERYAL